MQPNGSIGCPRAATLPGHPEHQIHGARHRGPATTVPPRVTINFRGFESDGTCEIVYDDEKRDLAGWEVVRGLTMGDLRRGVLAGSVLLEPDKTKALPVLAATKGKERRGNFSQNKSIAIANEKVILSGLLGLGLICSCQHGRGVHPVSSSLDALCLCYGQQTPELYFVRAGLSHLYHWLGPAGAYGHH